MDKFSNIENTKTDDIGYLVEVITRCLQPYFFVSIGAAVTIWGASSPSVSKDNVAFIVAAGTSLASAGLAIANPQQSSIRKNQNSTTQSTIQSIDSI